MEVDSQQPGIGHAVRDFVSSHPHRGTCWRVNHRSGWPGVHRRTAPGSDLILQPLVRQRRRGLPAFAGAIVGFVLLQLFALWVRLRSAPPGN